MHATAGIVIFLGVLAHVTTTLTCPQISFFRINFNKVWQYGCSATNFLDPAQFRVDEYADRTGPIGFWHPAVSYQPGPGYYPYIAFNNTKQSQNGVEQWLGHTRRRGRHGSQQYRIVQLVSFCVAGGGHLSDNRKV